MIHLQRCDITDSLVMEQCWLSYDSTLKHRWLCRICWYHSEYLIHQCLIYLFKCSKYQLFPLNFLVLDKIDRYRRCAEHLVKYKQVFVQYFNIVQFGDGTVEYGWMWNAPFDTTVSGWQKSTLDITHTKSISSVLLWGLCRNGAGTAFFDEMALFVSPATCT